MSGKVNSDFRPTATPQGWFSWVSWSAWFLNIFASISSTFYGEPKPLSDVVPLPKVVTHEMLTKYITTNFTPKLELADREITKGATGKASQTIAQLQEMEKLINVRNTPEVLINGYLWTPIGEELAKVQGLVDRLQDILLTYPPGSDALQDPRIHPSFGLDNIRNNCFINATLQMVFAIPILVEHIVFGEGQRIMVRRAYQRFRELLEQGEYNTNPNLASELRNLNKRFTGYGQHDAPEFLMALLDPLKKTETNPLFFAQEEKTYYAEYEMHRAEIAEEKEFTSDGARVKKGDPLSSLQLILPATANSPTIQELIRTTFDETILTEDTVQFHSIGEEDVRLKPSRKVIQVRPPDYLFIDLKRHAVEAQEFEGRGTFRGAKNNEEVSFQRTFYIPPEHDIDGKGAKYEWVALANQGGSYSGGHYVAYVAATNGKFYYYSDTTKSEKTEEEFLAAGRKFYLGFARRVRCDNIPGEMAESLHAGKVDKDIGNAINSMGWNPLSVEEKEFNLLKLFNRYLDEDEPSLPKLQRVYDLLPRSFHEFAASMTLLADPRDHLLDLKMIDRSLLVKRGEEEVATNIVKQYVQVRRDNLQFAHDHRGQLRRELELLVMQKERLEYLQTLEEEDQDFVAQIFEHGLDKLIKAIGIGRLLGDNARERQVITTKIANARLINM